MQPMAAISESTRTRPKVLIVGGEDVHARIDLMRGLADGYTLAAAGTSMDLATHFDQTEFTYFHYPLNRGLGPLSDLYAFMMLGCVLARFRPDIVHAFDTKPGVYGCLAARLAGVPVVVGTITGLGSLYGEEGSSTRIVRGIYEQLQRLASLVADLTLFQNRDDRLEFLARRIVPPGKSGLIAGSGVRTDVLDPARVTDAERRQTRASLGIPEDALVVTMVSRVIRSKGVEAFVAAAQQVRAQLPGTHFLLVGPADAASVDSFSAVELAEFARVVHWPGPRKDIPQVLAASDLFVLPSNLREGIPRVLLEAAAMGLPLITTDTPGCNDVVEDGVNGFLVPVRDPDALSQAIVRLLGQPELRRLHGRNSRVRAVERFDLAVVVEQTRTHYAELLLKAAQSRQRCLLPSPPVLRGRGVGGEGAGLFHAGKRAIDVAVAVFALVVTGPLILIGALAVKLSSPGPAFYRARRAGLHGQPFAMLKLRSMRVGADSPERKITENEDERVTAVGRWLRRFKIDELPQFWNVLRGDMSIVGPRPEDWDLVQQHYTTAQRRSLDVRPGIASPVDVDWYPDLTYHDPPPPGVPMQEHYLQRHLPVQVAEALCYADRQTPWLDLQVILRLVFCVLVRSWLPPRRRPLPAVPVPLKLRHSGEN